MLVSGIGKEPVTLLGHDSAEHAATRERSLGDHFLCAHVELIPPKFHKSLDRCPKHNFRYATPDDGCLTHQAGLRGGVQPQVFPLAIALQSVSVDGVDFTMHDRIYVGLVATFRDDFVFTCVDQNRSKGCAFVAAGYGDRPSHKLLMVKHVCGLSP